MIEDEEGVGDFPASGDGVVTTEAVESEVSLPLLPGVARCDQLLLPDTAESEASFEFS